MVSVAESAESAGKLDGLGPSGRRPEPGAAGVLGKSRRSHRLFAPRPGPRVPLREELASRGLASSQSQAGRAVLGTFSVWWRDLPARPPGGLRSPDPLILPEASPFSAQSAPLERPGCLVRPPGSESQVRGTAGICLRTLVRFPGRLEACTRRAPGRCLSTALNEV